MSSSCKGIKDVEVEILELLKEEPYTPTELSRIVNAHHLTVSRLLSRLMLKNPRIKCKRIGRYEIYWVKEDRLEEYIEYVRGNVSLTPRVKVLVFLLNKGGLSREAAVPLSEFSDEERSIIDGLAGEGRVVATTGGCVYLTEIGRLIAEGVKLVHGI